MYKYTEMKNHGYSTKAWKCSTGRNEERRKDSPASCAGNIHRTIRNKKRRRYKISIPGKYPKLPKHIRTPCENRQISKKNGDWQKETTCRLSHDPKHINMKLEVLRQSMKQLWSTRLIFVGLGTRAKARIRVTRKISSEPLMLCRWPPSRLVLILASESFQNPSHAMNLWLNWGIWESERDRGDWRVSTHCWMDTGRAAQGHLKARGG